MISSSAPIRGICSICHIEQGKIYDCHGGHYVCSGCWPKHRQETLLELEDFYRRYNKMNGRGNR